MKKWLIGLVLVISLLIGCSYFLIPDRIKISRQTVINANQQGAFRFLADQNNWARWWQGTITESAGTGMLTYGKYSFQIKKVLHNAFELNIAANNISTSSLLQIFSHSIDTISIHWSTEFIAGNNPIRRIQQYLAAKKMGIYFEDSLDALKKYISSLKNIYGIDIKKEKVQFQLLISTKQSFSYYPTSQEIYAMIDKLKNHLHKSNVKSDSLPMLNIQRSDSANYTVQVALPVPKSMPEGDNISVKWMMKNGNILTGEVTGGIKRIDSSMKQFDKYISDYQRSVIAIPFQLLITDRLKETDSTKWVTRLYYPVI